MEVGLLAEVFRLTSSKGICQVEIAESYEHKHQDLSARDPSRGLHKMAIDIAHRIFRTVAGQGIRLDTGAFDTLLTAYRGKAEDTLRFYSADAEINGLSYDRHSEELAVTTFAHSIRLAARAYLDDPLEDPLIPDWNRVQSALPDILEDFKTAARGLRVATCHMRILLSRDSVCMGDDVDSHDVVFELADATGLEAILQEIIDRSYLPDVAAEIVTWSVSSKEPLAIIAQGHPHPRLLTRMPELILYRNLEGGILRLHCSYIGHIDPELVAGVLGRFSLPGEHAADAATNQ